MIQGELEKEEEGNFREHLKGREEEEINLTCRERWLVARCCIICHRAYYFHALLPQKLISV